MASKVDKAAGGGVKGFLAGAGSGAAAVGLVQGLLSGIHAFDARYAKGIEDYGWGRVVTSSVERRAIWRVVTRDGFHMGIEEMAFASFKTVLLQGAVVSAVLAADRIFS